MVILALTSVPEVTICWMTSGLLPTILSRRGSCPILPFALILMLVLPFYKEFIKQNDARSNTKEGDSTVAAQNSDSTDDTKSVVSVEDRYYNCQEYTKLSATKKAGLRPKRKKDGKQTRQQPQPVYQETLG